MQIKAPQEFSSFRRAGNALRPEVNLYFPVYKHRQIDLCKKKQRNAFNAIKKSNFVPNLERKTILWIE